MECTASLFWSTQARRSMFSACRTFSACELRTGYGFTTRTCDVRARYVHVRPRAQHRESFLNPIVTCFACRARYKFVVGGSVVRAFAREREVVGSTPDRVIPQTL